MKTPEIIRLISFAILGFVLMFYGQPWIYQSRILLISDQPVDYWISNQYMPGAWLVFAVSLAATCIWYVWGSTAKILSGKETEWWERLWWLLSVAPLLGIIATQVFFNTSQDARVSMIGFFILDAIFLFWLPTSTSSPEPVKHVPLGAVLMRRLIR